MGQEITFSQYDAADTERFHQRLRQETELLSRLIKNNTCSTCKPVAGFEIEAWLVDRKFQPAPTNELYQ